MKYKEIPVEDAIGLTLAHDMTQIVPGEFKGTAFHKGHVIQEEDVPRLYDMGKRHIYVLELEAGEVHENDAAIRMANALAGPHVKLSDVHEGKVVLKAASAGMLWVDVRRVTAMNLIDDVSIATRTPYLHVDEGTSIAGVRPIPLVIDEEKVRAVELIAEEAVGGKAMIDVLPYKPQRVVLVTTGSEIESGRIVDKAGPVLRGKFARYGLEVLRQEFVGDDVSRIEQALKTAHADGATLVCVTGGMSVDPDDKSPLAIRNAATHVVTYGTPILPGSMLMLAYLRDMTIFGLPGAVIYDDRTSFDLLLPRVLAGIAVTKQDIAPLGVGGWLNV
ncbi:MAG: molybdopterin-binding protein [Alicyclobacillaceae bacterium]|nr:molybdopterin-binding protein [Alicyclobacillaceae bacterium]